jgi:hypothetical protein
MAAAGIVVPGVVVAPVAARARDLLEVLIDTGVTVALRASGGCAESGSEQHADDSCQKRSQAKNAPPCIHS